MPGDGLAHRREAAGELEHVVELLLVPPQPPHVVIAVLPPAGGIDASGLDVAHGMGADPHVGPRRRDHQRPHPRQYLVVGHPLTVGVEVHRTHARCGAW